MLPNSSDGRGVKIVYSDKVILIGIVCIFE